MNTFKALTRWDEWADSKTPLFFAAAYTWLLTGPASAGDDVVMALLWLGFTGCLLAFGYAVNDYADAEPDRLAGKPNAISHLPSRRAALFLVALALAGPAFLLPWLARPWVAAGLLLAYFFALTYSWPPIRFKERGPAGLVVSAAAQRCFPLLVGMALFGRFDLVSWVMALLFFLKGARWILVHQIGDIEADRLGGVSSFARARGAVASLRLMQWGVFPLELLCLFVWVALAARAAPFVLAVLPLYALWLAAATRALGRLPVAWTRFGQLPLTRFYLIFWPAALALGAALAVPAAAGLLAVQWLWQWPYLAGEWRKLFPAAPGRPAGGPD